MTEDERKALIYEYQKQVEDLRRREAVYHKAGMYDEASRLLVDIIVYRVKIKELEKEK